MDNNTDTLFSVPLFEGQHTELSMAQRILLVAELEDPTVRIADDVVAREVCALWTKAGTSWVWWSTLMERAEDPAKAADLIAAQLQHSGNFQQLHIVSTGTHQAGHILLDTPWLAAVRQRFNGVLVSRAVQQVLDTLTVGAWEVLYSLHTSWQGSVGELLETCMRLGGSAELPRAGKAPNNSVLLQNVVEALLTKANKTRTYGAYTLAVLGSDGYSLQLVLQRGMRCPGVRRAARDVVGARLRGSYLTWWALDSEVDSLWPSDHSQAVKWARQRRSAP